MFFFRKSWVFTVLDDPYCTREIRLFLDWLIWRGIGELFLQHDWRLFDDLGILYGMGERAFIRYILTMPYIIVLGVGAGTRLRGV